jgi:glycosyltransferase involved in cell wall biosynthesis
MSSPQVDNVSPKSTQKHDPLHVVHLIESLGPGGAERLLYTNLKHFDTTRIRSTVIVVYPQATHWVKPITELGVPIVSLDCQSTREIPQGIRRLRKWLRNNRPDIIHSHLWAANIIGRIAARLTGVPLVSSIHNPDHEPQTWADGAGVSMVKRLTAKLLDRWTAQLGSDRLIAVSEYVKQSAGRDLHFSLDLIDRVYNPVDVNLLQAPVEKNRDELLRECGLPADCVMLLNVARVSAQKGLLYALQALPEILRQFPSAHLVSVGATTDPDWTARLEREADSLGVADHFHLLGARRNVMDFLHACDVFVFPSLYEGFGIALVEAMGAGCACIATNVGPIPEVITDGIDGVLVPPGDAVAIAQVVCELLSKPSMQMQLGKAAAITAIRQFRPEDSADRLIQVYESVLAAAKS